MILLLAAIHFKVLPHEISQMEKDNTISQVHIHREQIGGCQGSGVGEMGEGGLQVQTVSYKIDKS